MKRRSQTGHTNFFSPVCVRRCRDSSSERANCLSQLSQLQLKGFSPEGGDERGGERGMVREERCRDVTDKIIISC